MKVFSRPAHLKVEGLKFGQLQVYLNWSFIWKLMSTLLYRMLLCVMATTTNNFILLK